MGDKLKLIIMSPDIKITIEKPYSLEEIALIVAEGFAVLPEFMSGKRIEIVEGEKDAEARGS
jgi:hypothetical protein